VTKTQTSQSSGSSRRNVWCRARCQDGGLYHGERSRVRFQAFLLGSMATGALTQPTVTALVSVALESSLPTFFPRLLAVVSFFVAEHMAPIVDIEMRFRLGVGLCLFRRLQQDDSHLLRCRLVCLYHTHRTTTLKSKNGKKTNRAKKKPNTKKRTHQRSQIGESLGNACGRKFSSLNEDSFSRHRHPLDLLGM
jgi:hypothetical protein